MIDVLITWKVLLVIYNTSIYHCSLAVKQQLVQRYFIDWCLMPALSWREFNDKLTDNLTHLSLDLKQTKIPPKKHDYMECFFYLRWTDLQVIKYLEGTIWTGVLLLLYYNYLLTWRGVLVTTLCLLQLPTNMARSTRYNIPRHVSR
jgi:hypothetical protein